MGGFCLDVEFSIEVLLILLFFVWEITAFYIGDVVFKSPGHFSISI